MSKKEKETELKDYLDNPESSNLIFIYPERQGDDPNNKFGSNFGSSSYTFEDCAPLVSVQHALTSEDSDETITGIGTGSTEVSAITTITMNGYLFGNGVSEVLNKQKELDDELKSNKSYTIEINNSNGQLLKTFYGCEVQSINHEEGVYVSYSKYSITFETGNSRENTYYHTDFSYSLAITLNEDYSHLNAAGTELLSSPGYYIATETINATANYGSGKHGSVNALDFVNSKSRFSSSAGESIYLSGSGWKGNESGTHYKVKNYRSGTTVDPTTREVTKTATFILAPNANYQKALAQYNLEYSSSVEDPNVTYTITGSVLGLKGVSDAANVTHMSNAQLGYNSFSATFLAKIKATFPAAAVAATQVNSTSFSWNSTRNYNAGTIEFSVVYNTRPTNDITGDDGKVITSFEKIESTDSGGTTVLNIVPVIGRELGPILQDTGTVSERTRDFTLEVVYLKGKGSSNGPGTSDIVDDYAPPKGSINQFVYITADSSTWNPNEYRYVRNITWVYEPYPS
jgi:hypothetical protein